nr:MAG TPA: hypothetical protein [Caudoviricetes sp.]
MSISRQRGSSRFVCLYSAVVQAGATFELCGFRFITNYSEFHNLI